MAGGAQRHDLGERRRFVDHYCSDPLAVESAWIGATAAAVEVVEVVATTKDPYSGWIPCGQRPTEGSGAELVCFQFIENDPVIAWPDAITGFELVAIIAWGCPITIGIKFDSVFA